jgi:putative transposase
MARKRYKPEEIVAKLRQVDVLVSQGQNMVDAMRQIGVSEVTLNHHEGRDVRTVGNQIFKFCEHAAPAGNPNPFGCGGAKKARFCFAGNRNTDDRALGSRLRM